MYSVLNTLLARGYVYCRVYGIVYLVITSVWFGYHINNVWQPNCGIFSYVPVVNIFTKVIPTSKLMVIPYTLQALLIVQSFVFGTSPEFLLLMLILTAFGDYVFARVVFPDNAKLYAFCPFVKYYLMYREVHTQWSNTNKEKTTKKKSLPKKISK